MIPSMTVIFIWILLIGYRITGITCIVRNCEQQKSLSLSTEIPNSDYNASSFAFDDFGRYEAFKARVSDTSAWVVNDVAWCPDPQDKDPWLEVNLKGLKIIELLAFGGRGIYKSRYTPLYKLKYKRDDLEPWTIYKSLDGQIVHEAGKNNRDLEYRTMKRNVIAKRIRIYPINNSDKNTLCLRLGILGFDFPDGVLNYEAPVGAFLNQNQLIDHKYNGDIVNGNMEHGVGSLLDCDEKTDARYGFKITLNNGKSYAVAWKKSSTKKYVKLLFNFNQVYQFKQALFYTLQNTELNFYYFTKAEVEFSISGTFDSKRKLTITPKLQGDTLILPLEERVGKSLWITLYFSDMSPDSYIALSEVKFDNKPYDNKVPIEPPVTKKANSNNRNQTFPSNPLPPDSSGGGGVPPPRGTTVANGNSNPSIQKEMSSIIAFACLLFGLIICTILGLYFFCKSRRLHHEKSSACLEQNGMVMGGPQIMSMNSYKHYATQDNGYFNSLRAATMTTALNGNGGVEQARYPLLKDSLYTTVPTDDEDEVASNEKGSSGRGSTINPYAACSIPRKWCGNMQMPLGAEYASASLFSSPGANYAPPDGSVVYQSHLNGNTYPTLQMLPNGEFIDSRGTVPQNGLSYGAGFRTLPIPPAPKFPSNINIQGVTGSSVYACPEDQMKQTDPNHTIKTNSTGSSSMSLTELNVPDVNINDLRLLERLGSGNFGEIHLAEYSSSTAAPDMPLIAYSTGDEAEMRKSPSRLVSVKIIRTDASSTARRDLQTETYTLARLNDSNIAQIIGICREQGCFYVVMEHGKHGDLHQFLRNRHLASSGTDPQFTLTSQPPSSSLYVQDANSDVEGSMAVSYGCLIYMAMQIASGMKYLESLKIVHRDVACRNCLVDSKFSVKISDLGMSRRLYAADYYRSDNNSILPIRWMAWEALLEGRFSTKSDVWAFAVTLWEILTFCRQPPLSQLNDEQVVENLRTVSLYTEKEQGVHASNGPGVLPKIEIPLCSSNIPKEIYDLMKECWQKRPEYRPAFSEIHMFLRRKNLGFNADEEYQLSKSSAGTVSPMLS